MWDWYTRPGEWRNRGGHRTGLVVAISLATVVGGALFIVAVALTTRVFTLGR